jgi:hypothetical protein
LLEPEVAFSGKQAFAEKALGGVAETGTFFKFLRLADENFFDQVGIAEEDARLKEQREVDNVTVFAGEVSEEAGGVVEKFGSAAAAGPTARAGGFGVRVSGGAWRFGGKGVGAVSAHEFSLPAICCVFALGADCQD